MVQPPPRSQWGFSALIPGYFQGLTAKGAWPNKPEVSRLLTGGSTADDVRLRSLPPPRLRGTPTPG